jgi:hypothetical protein
LPAPSIHREVWEIFAKRRAMPQQLYKPIALVIKRSRSVRFLYCVFADWQTALVLTRGRRPY